MQVDGITAEERQDMDDDYSGDERDPMAQADGMFDSDGAIASSAPVVPDDDAAGAFDVAGEPEIDMDLLSASVEELLHEAGISAGELDDETFAITLSHHQKDVFHALQSLSFGFGTTNTWCPLFLKAVSEVLLVPDPEVKQEIVEYLTSQHLESQPVGTRGTAAGIQAAKTQAQLQYHSFVRKNPKYIKKMPLAPLRTFGLLKKIEYCFAACVCTKKSKKRDLFSPNGSKEWKKLLDMVTAGHHGQNPNVARYQCVRRCPKTNLREFKCLVGTNWVEGFHNAQRDSAPQGTGMIFADLMLHGLVDRKNTDARILHRGKPGFGSVGIPCYRDKVIERLHQVRQRGGIGVGKLFGDTANEADKFVGTNTDTQERFGIGWQMEKWFAALMGPDCGTVKTFNQLEAFLAFNAVEVGGTVTVLDIRVLAVLVVGKELSEDQDAVLNGLDLSALSRAGAKLTALVDCVCEVLDGQPGCEPEPESEPEAEAAGQPTRVSRRAANLAPEEVREGRDWLTAASHEKVNEKLEWLLDVDDEGLVVDMALDSAFMAYTEQLAVSPVSSLQRDYRTGETTLQRFNKLQGRDETQIYSGIHTTKGYELFEEILVKLSNNNRHRVAISHIAVEWNQRVVEMLDKAANANARKVIMSTYGYVGDKDAQKHQDRVRVLCVYY